MPANYISLLTCKIFVSPLVSGFPEIITVVEYPPLKNFNGPKKLLALKIIYFIDGDPKSDFFTN
jgi:hypothetical protein